MLFYTYVYFIDDVPEYVGKGCNSRFLAHFVSSKCTKWANHLKKSQRNGRKIVAQLFIHPSEDSAYYAVNGEVFWIKHYGRKDLGIGPLYNTTNGGEGVSGRIVSEEERQAHIRASKKVWECLTEEEKIQWCKNMSDFWQNQTVDEKERISQMRSAAEKNRPPEIEAARVQKMSESHKKPCTIDREIIFGSLRELINLLGQGRHGSRSLNLYYLNVEEVSLWKSGINPFREISNV